LHQKNGAGLGVAASYKRNNRAIFYARLLAKGRFEVFRIHVEAGGRNDDVFLAATKTQIAFSIEFAEVASAQPALLIRSPNGSLFPVAAGNIFATNEDFAVFSELEFAARKDFAHGTLRRAKRVIQADQRG